MRFLMLLFGLFSISACVHDATSPMMYTECASQYMINEMYFKDSDTLSFDVRFVYFSDRDSLSEKNALIRLGITNHYYSQARIKFNLVEVLNVKGNPKDELGNQFGPDDIFDIERFHEYSAYYNRYRVINIYIFDRNTKSRFAGVAGGIPSTYLAVRADYFFNPVVRTLEHELGHCLGLYHTHQKPDANGGYTIESGDFVCDTPAGLDYLVEQVDSECEFEQRTNLTTEEVEVLVKNIMSYSRMGCRQEFTDGQIKRMRWTIEQSQDLRNCLD